ncbi:MAG: DUF167 domain-containing protein [Alphaproteobacteria bacterium]|nr:DUF167 domain-containing protein [Rickettsiales bacterium]
MKQKIKITVKTATNKCGVFGTQYNLFEEKQLIVRTKEKAQNGKANKDIINIISKYFNIRQSDVKITSGLTSKNKTVTIKMATM